VIAEFREFVNRGSFIDLAVGFVMGVAISGVINSIVERLLMPLVAVFFGQPDFESVGQFACEDGVCAGSVGAVITALINFLLVALALFFVVKAYNRLQRNRSGLPEPEEVILLREIRDSLASAPSDPSGQERSTGI
jgi:large conductance mechanosensitive channel